MMQRWQQWSEKFAALSAREKWLISLGGIVGLFFSLLTLLIDPSSNELKSKRSQLSDVDSTIQQMQGQILVTTAKLKRDPDKELNIEFQELLEESLKLSDELAGKVDGLVTPDKMAELIEQVLNHGNKLNLNSLSSLPAEPIQSAEASAVSGYFIHPVKIEFSGEYFDVIEYLQALESLPVKYFWRSFHYSVEEYPNAKVVLVVYTLGSGEEFIGG